MTADRPFLVPQELEERVLRIIRAAGATEAIAKEKALPGTQFPNELLLLTLKALEAVDAAKWGENSSAGFKEKVLAWVVASTLAPAPPPDEAQRESKRLMQHAKEVRSDLEKAAANDAKQQAIRQRPYRLFNLSGSLRLRRWQDACNRS